MGLLGKLKKVGAAVKDSPGYLAPGSGIADRAGAAARVAQRQTAAGIQGASNFYQRRGEDIAQRYGGARHGYSGNILGFLDTSAASSLHNLAAGIRQPSNPKKLGLAAFEVATLFPAERGVMAAFRGARALRGVEAAEQLGGRAALVRAGELGAARVPGAKRAAADVASEAVRKTVAEAAREQAAKDIASTAAKGARVLGKPGSKFTFERKAGGELFLNGNRLADVLTNKVAVPGFEKNSEEAITALRLMKNASRVHFGGPAAEAAAAAVEQAAPKAAGTAAARVAARKVASSTPAQPVARAVAETAGEVAPAAPAKKLAFGAVKQTPAEVERAAKTATRRAGPVTTRKIGEAAPAVEDIRDVAARAFSNPTKAGESVIPKATHFVNPAEKTLPAPGKAAAKGSLFDRLGVQAPVPTKAAATTAAEVAPRAAAEAQTPAAKVASRAFRAVNKTAAPATATAEKAAKAATEPSALRSAVREMLGKGTLGKGSQIKLAAEHGVSKQRVGQIVSAERGRLAKASEVAARGVIRNATETAPRVAEPAAAAVKASAPAAETAEKAVRVARTAPAAEAVAAASQRAGGSIAGKAARIAGRATGLSPFPKKTAALIGAATGATVALTARGRSGSSPQSADDTFLASVPEDIRANVKALMKVRKEKGEAGLQALVEGRQHYDIGGGNTKRVARAKALHADAESERLRENVRTALKRIRSNTR